MRCLSLARALRMAGATCCFITRALPGHMGDLIMNEGFEVRLLSAPQEAAPHGPPYHAHWAGVDWAEDAAETRALMVEEPDWLVMDHYAFDARWQRAARPEDTKLFVIDDLADRPHECDLLLDQNLGRDERDYDGLVPQGCKLLVGPRYALLRPEFSEMRAEALATRSGRRLERLIVSMGGIDLVDGTSAVLDALRDVILPEELEISVIMGKRAPALEKIRALARDMPRRTEVAVDVHDMARRMADADLAIGAGGSTTWERCCLGLPSIIVEIADNQAGISAAIARAGAGLSAGSLHGLDFVQRFSETIEKVGNASRLASLSEAAARLCDGDGVERIVLMLSEKRKLDNAAEVRV